MDINEIIGTLLAIVIGAIAVTFLPWYVCLALYICLILGLMSGIAKLNLYRRL
jgi:ABC-type xylose transport system permease subunit